MSNVFIGNAQMQELAIERGWDKKKGFYTTRRWSGQQSVAETLRANLIDSGLYASVVLKEGPVWTVEATVDSDVDDNNEPDPDESAVDTWELSGNRVEKDLLSADVSSINSISADDQKKLRAFERGDKNWETDAWGGTASGAAENLYLLMRSGVKSSLVVQPILRRTATVSDNYVVPASLTNVLTVRKTSTLTGEETIPASIANNLPASTSVTKGSLTFWYGWLKGYPTITDTIDGKVQVQQEWEFGLWSTVLYTVA